MFMFERLLEDWRLRRIRKNFILKGGLLISSMVGLEGRTTMDMDTTVRGHRRIAVHLCALGGQNVLGSLVGVGAAVR